MVKEKSENNVRRLHTLLAELSSVGPFTRGSVVRLGPRKTPMLSLNKEHRTHLVYLGESRLEQARQYSENYQRLLGLVEEITRVVMELLRAGVPPDEIWPPRAAMPLAKNRAGKKRL